MNTRKPREKPKNSLKWGFFVQVNKHSTYIAENVNMGQIRGE